MYLEAKLMPSLTLKAHFDGTHIMLDEPYDLQPGTPIAVTVFPNQADLETAQWLRIASAGLARAYGDDEPEYTDADIKP
jgi:hypothetical protein